jgi:hypothetical protein
MLYPNVFIEKKFWQILDDESSKIKSSSPFDFNKSDKIRKHSFERILALIRGSNIYTDEILTDTDFRQIASLNDNAKSVILKEIIKADSIECSRKLNLGKKITELDTETDICFFTADEFNNCENKTNEDGKIHIGKEFLQREFFINNTFPVEHTDKDLSKLDKIFHPCNSLVIIDPYLFTNFDKKKTYLFNFLKKIISQTLKKPFKIDIVVKNNDRYNDVIKANNMILAEFDKISLHIYYSKALNDSESDRYLITNYALIAIGHPFDRESNISSNFFPSNPDENLVVQAYNSRIKKLEFIKKIMDKTPDFFLGNLCVLKNDENKHEIFSFTN